MITIGTRTISPSDLFFVVEEGQFNQGDFSQALKMIELAAGTGADAIEFQLAIAEDFYITNHSGFAIYKEREFSQSQLRELVGCCRQYNIEMIVAPFSRRIVESMADFGCSAFNINASDLNNPSILRSVVESGLPFFMSLPLATTEEIKWACDYIHSCADSAPRFILLHGQHTMASGANGVAPMDTSLGFLQEIKRTCDGLAGFIDHTPFPWFPACAAAAGANIITKHMSPGHEEKGPDWPICLDPQEMQSAIAAARAIRASINQTAKVLAPGENLDRTEMRRSIVFASDLPAGHEITPDDLVFKRPGNGVSPDQETFFIGRRLASDVFKDDKAQLTSLIDQ